VKILHCCFACFYVDNYGYQENILPKQHKLDGHEVEILASTETYSNNKTIGYVKPSSYVTESGIPVTRLPYSKFLPHFIMRKLRIYKGLKESIDKFMPEIIFIHDCQFIDIRKIAEYARENPSVKVFVDGHTDFNNSAKNWLSRNILHKIIYRYCAKIIEPYTTKFYGVLPARCDFFYDVYKIPREKIELLTLGAEKEKINTTKRDVFRKSLCNHLGLKTDDFIVVTGGKIDKRKNISALIDALQLLNCEKVKLMIFGSLINDVKKEIEIKLDNPNIKYIGWIKADDAYDYFTSADLVVFPGLHSVLWEQAVACGVPCLFKDIEGFHHVDFNGNCKFLKEGSAEEIADILRNIISNEEMYKEMKICALNCAENFYYSDIAKRAIQLI